MISVSYQKALVNYESNQMLVIEKKYSDEIFGPTQVNHRWTGGEGWQGRCPAGLAQRALQSDCLV